MNKGSDARPLPCPFCGGAEFGVPTHAVKLWVDCLNEDCGAEGPLRDTREEAIAAWNTRALTKVEDTE